MLNKLLTWLARYVLSDQRSCPTPGPVSTWMGEYCQQQYVAPKNSVVSSSKKFMQIFAEVPWRVGVKQQVEWP